jgi:hypothetical protein
VETNSVTDFTFVSKFYELPKPHQARCLKQMVKRYGFGRNCSQSVSVVLYLTTFDPLKSVESLDAGTSTPEFVKVIGCLKRFK